MFRPLLIVAVLALAGCATTPSSTYYYDAPGDYYYGANSPDVIVDHRGSVASPWWLGGFGGYGYGGYGYGGYGYGGYGYGYAGYGWGGGYGYGGLGWPYGYGYYGPWIYKPHAPSYPSLDTRERAVQAYRGERARLQGPRERPASAGYAPPRRGAIESGGVSGAYRDSAPSRFDASRARDPGSRGPMLERRAPASAPSRAASAPRSMPSMPRSAPSMQRSAPAPARAPSAPRPAPSRSQ
ncbi:hypothetical protein ACQQ2N_02245 [Dokdonella sp. MW10]|uniref:hypothetical protein n=1 Tax=Dokdonella sp. MW10 TaxID=2992926 RepID=UPI003F81D4FA